MPRQYILGAGPVEAPVAELPARLCPAPLTAAASSLRTPPIAASPPEFRSPWQNGLVERLIGSARRECTDHLIVFNEGHLRRILSEYASYYNEVRTHLSLGKDAPCTRPIERFGHIIAQPILGGLHHRYARI
jgi:Integrase core domain